MPERGPVRPGERGVRVHRGLDRRILRGRLYGRPVRGQLRQSVSVQERRSVRQIQRHVRVSPRLDRSHVRVTVHGRARMQPGVSVPERRRVRPGDRRGVLV